MNDLSKANNLDKKQDAEKIQRQIAVSIEYEGSGAPKVTAKGRGYIAEEIIEKAKRSGIPLQKNHELVELLSQVELNHEIPETLYEAVAQVLVFAYELSGKELPPKKTKKT